MPPPPLVLVESICFSTQCQPVDANWFVHFISSFGYFPVWLLMFNFLLGFVNLDLYYLIASKIAFTVIYYYVLLLATLMKYERPAGGNQFEKCGWQRYSFPDASFVTSMVYSLAVIFGFWVDRRIHRYLTRWHTFLMAVVVSLYMASTIVTGYFSFEQLAANFFVLDKALQVTQDRLLKLQIDGVEVKDPTRKLGSVHCGLRVYRLAAGMQATGSTAIFSRRRCI